MNLAEHLHFFYQELKQGNTNRYPVSLLKEWFDKAEEVINNDSKIIFGSSIIDSVADQRLYNNIPDDSLQWGITDIYYSTTDSTERKQLKPVDMMDLDKFDRKWRERTGTPNFWYYDKTENKFGLYPYEQTVQTGTNCIEIKYRKKHTKMTVYYTTGTITTNGTENIVGSGSSWSGNVSAGDKLGVGTLALGADMASSSFPTTWYTISSVTDNTNLVLSSAYTGSDGSSQSYIIASESSINDKHLNYASITWAQALAKKMDGDFSSMQALRDEALFLVRERMAQRGYDAASQEPMVPDLAAPYPGTRYDDYQ